MTGGAIPVEPQTLSTLPPEWGSSEPQPSSEDKQGVLPREDADRGERRLLGWHSTLQMLLGAEAVSSPGDLPPPPGALWE